MEAKITLICDNGDEAEAISRAVSPDNVEVPRGLLIETRAEGSRVITVIKYEGDNVATFLSTIDDLLSCAATAEKTLSIVREK
ncbi:MAG: KEOPS complex subunit Pcc1 [Candidatus Bathyarchaeia archaeon]|nr:hypothetical protein [Candidatus Bathyarchaeota archaeon]